MSYFDHFISTFSGDGSEEQSSLDCSLPRSKRMNGMLRARGNPRTATRQCLLKKNAIFRTALYPPLGKISHVFPLAGRGV